MAATSPSTRLVALLGDPVAHSLSPRFQNAAFAAAGVDGVYVALRCDTAALSGLLTGIALAGGAGNVTIPHKALAAQLVGAATDAVRRTGACNTFWLEAGRVHGDNTDVVGVHAAVRALTGSPAGARVLVIGAGGAASAALCALLDEGVGRVEVMNRSPDRARNLLAGFGPDGRLGLVPDADALAGERFDLAINATPLGLHRRDPAPLDLDRPAGIGAVLDLSYAPGETAWVHDARRRGIRAADGREMLLAQGAVAFERWWGIPAPSGVMRRALEEGAGRPVSSGPA